MTSQEAVELAFNCHSVYSLRSGFCDLLYTRGNRLTVYYPTYASLFLYSLNDMFGRGDICEEIHLVQNNIPPVITSVPAGQPIRKTKVYLFGFIPLFSIRQSGNKTKVRMFDIPILKFKTKIQ